MSESETMTTTATTTESTEIAGRVTLEYEELGECKRAAWTARRIEIKSEPAADGAHVLLELTGATLALSSAPAVQPEPAELSVPRVPVPPRESGLGEVTVRVAGLGPQLAWATEALKHAAERVETELPKSKNLLSELQGAAERVRAAAQVEGGPR